MATERAMTKAEYDAFVERHGRPHSWQPWHSRRGVASAIRRQTNGERWGADEHAALASILEDIDQ